MENKLSVGGVARGGVFVFISSVTVSILAFAYWFLISSIGGTEVIGVASSIFSLSLLVSGIIVLGVPTGVQRFLGQGFGRNNTKMLNTYFWSSFAFTLVISLVSALIIWIIALLNIHFIAFSQSMLISTGFLVLLGFSSIIDALFFSVIKTEYTAISGIISGITKLGLGALLVYLGLGWVGAIIGGIIASLVLVSLAILFALKVLRRLGHVKKNLSFNALRKSVNAGFVIWLPLALDQISRQLGILTVFGLHGSLDTGTYFIAYTIYNIVSTLPGSFMPILFPVLSGLTEGHREATWKVLRFCLAITCPVVAFIVFYAAFPLSLIGGQYIQAAPTLSILTLSLIPLVYDLAVSFSVYASGSYGKVLGIGLATTVPRLLLYFWLVPIYSGFGAALSFLMGSLVGTGAAVYASRKTDFQVSTMKITVAVAGPFAAGLLCFLVGLDWFIGAVVILLFSVLCYGRLGVVKRSDLKEIARAFASEKTVAKAGERLNWLLKIIYGE